MQVTVNDSVCHYSCTRFYTVLVFVRARPLVLVLVLGLVLILNLILFYAGSCTNARGLLFVLFLNSLVVLVFLVVLSERMQTNSFRSSVTVNKNHSSIYGLFGVN
jgi:hypothetical protein